MHRFPRLSGAACCVFAFACAPTDDAPDAPETCALTAQAGIDAQGVLGTTVSLSAADSTVCGTGSTRFQWQFAEIPDGSATTDGDLSDNGSVTAYQSSFTPDVAGTYVLAVELSDGDVHSAQDLVVVEVTAGDLGPVADCGVPTEGVVGKSLVFDAGGSFDPEGAPLEYSWVLAGVPSCSALETGDLGGAQDESVVLVPDCDGAYTVALRVSDGVHESDTDYCNATVASENQIPIADGGAGGSVSTCDGAFALSGYSSYDAETWDLAYAWAIWDEPHGSLATDASFDDQTAVAPVFEADQSGTYVFSLQVFDGEAWSAPDLVSYDVEVGDCTP